MFPHLHLFGASISTYFLVISLGVCIALVWFIRRAGLRHLNHVTAIDFALVVTICGFLGARLLHVVYEDWTFYSANPLQIFVVWNGGFVFYGGLIGAFVGASLFCSWTNEAFWFWADTAALPISLAYAIGRLGCFLNGCCYGKVCALPWAVRFDEFPRHPTQLYATGWELMVLCILTLTERRFKTTGFLFSTWLILHSLGRVIMEAFRDDPRGESILGLSLGTLISGGIILMAVGQMLASRLHSIKDNSK
ncbi:MAG: prolipoprotein diacylglyceryl transferase [Bdellovibrionales bacterium]